MDDFCRFGMCLLTFQGSAHFCHRLQFLPSRRWGCNMGLMTPPGKKTKTPKTPKTPGSSDNQQSSQGVPRRRRKFFVQSDKAIDGRHIEASINGGTPIAGWLISWKILLKWMIWGSPHFRKPPYCGIFRYMRYCDINHSVISCIYTLEQPFFMGLI